MTPDTQYPADDGGPAFPVIRELNGSSDRFIVVSTDGMSLRDWFAGQALVGWLSGPCQGAALNGMDSIADPTFLDHQRAVADTCYGYADAMLRAREADKS